MLLRGVLFAAVLGAGVTACTGDDDAPGVTTEDSQTTRETLSATAFTARFEYVGDYGDPSLDDERYEIFCYRDGEGRERWDFPGPPEMPGARYALIQEGGVTDECLVTESTAIPVCEGVHAPDGAGFLLIGLFAFLAPPAGDPVADMLSPAVRPATVGQFKGHCYVPAGSTEDSRFETCYRDDGLPLAVLIRYQGDRISYIATEVTRGVDPTVFERKSTAE